MLLSAKGKRQIVKRLNGVNAQFRLQHLTVTVLAGTRQPSYFFG